MNLVLHPVYSVNGKQAIKLSSFAKITNYSDTYLSSKIKKLKGKGINISTKWKRNEYIYLPNKPKQNSDGSKSIALDYVETPSGDKLTIDWEAAFSFLSPSVNRIFIIQSVLLWFLGGYYLVVSAPYTADSSTLSPKNPFLFVPPKLANFKATTEYKYGYYIIYDEAKMSVFNPGAAGTLKSTQLPSALFEVCRALDAAENTRNGANPGLAPRRNISTTVSFDTGLISVAATIPVTPSIGAGGLIQLTASDYLGAPYSTFANGGGDLTSDTLPEALLEVANLLAAAEKAVTPAENQPNNVQISFDLETGSATISANMPFTTTAADNGDVTVHAIDYL